MDKREDPYGEYSPAEEERFRKDLELALELSLQEQSMVDYSTELEWVLRGDLNGNDIDVSRPVALPKDHPVVDEIRADVEGAEVSELRRQLRRSSIHNDAVKERMVLERLSQASSWAQQIKAERGRGADRVVPDLDDDMDTIPNLDDISGRDVEHIPRRPVGEGALKKVPARKQRAGKARSDEPSPPPPPPPPRPRPSPARRSATLPPAAATAALLRKHPEGGAAPPPLPKRNDDAGWRTPPSETEEFLRDLEIARQNSLMENWASVNENEAAPQTTVDTNGRASATAGSDVAAIEPHEEIFGWLSNAQRHDPQLVKITKAIKDYLARTGKKEPNQPCKYCPDKCECIYVTADYLEQYGMVEVVSNSCGVELLSGGSDLELTSSGEHKLDSPPPAAGQLRRQNGAVAAQGSAEVQRSGSGNAAPQDKSDPDPVAFVERWYANVQAQSSESESEVNNSAMDRGSADIPTDSPVRVGSVENGSNLSPNSQQTNGWKSRTKYGNEKLGIHTIPSWKTASRVWSPVAEDRLMLRPNSKYPSFPNTLPPVNYYPPEEDSSTPSNELSDDTTPDAVEMDSQPTRDWCPDMENKEKF